MKRTFFVSVFCLTFFGSYAQVKLGLRFSPSVGVNRITSLSDTLVINKEKSSVLMVLGLFSEIPLTDTYSISTGINFAPKRVNLAFQGENGDSYANAVETYKLQYLQIPVLLKLFTDDIQPGFRAYFHVGPILDIKIFDSPLDNAYHFIEKFRPVDTSLAIGAGTELELGISTVAFAGFSYNRGMANIISTSFPMDSKPIIKNDFFQIELGLKF